MSEILFIIMYFSSHKVTYEMHINSTSTMSFIYKNKEQKPAFLRAKRHATFRNWDALLIDHCGFQ